MIGEGILFNGAVQAVSSVTKTVENKLYNSHTTVLIVLNFSMVRYHTSSKSVAILPKLLLHQQETKEKQINGSGAAQNNEDEIMNDTLDEDNLKEVPVNHVYKYTSTTN